MNTKRISTQEEAYCCYYPNCKSNIKKELQEEQRRFTKRISNSYEKIKSRLSVEHYIQIISSSEPLENLKHQQLVNYLAGKTVSEFIIICKDCQNTLSYRANESTGEIIEIGIPFPKKVAAMRTKTLSMQTACR